MGRTAGRWCVSRRREAPGATPRSAFLHGGRSRSLKAVGGPLQHPLQPLSTVEQRAVAADACTRSSERELAGHCT